MTIFFDIVLRLLNRGLLLLPVFGAVIVLRPVTNRLLRPKYRVWLWLVGWLMCSFYLFYGELPGLVRLLPFTLRSVVQPRSAWDSGEPLYFPDEYLGAGEYTAVFPGGVEWSFALNDGTALLLTALFVVTGWLAFRLCVKWEQLDRFVGEVVEEYELPDHPELGFRDGHVAVRVCRGLSTSFVVSGSTPAQPDARYVIFLQEELSPERRELVLLHEIEHLRRFHLWMKGILATALVLFWWNPMVWAAFRLTCRDMELACDEAVMNRLAPEQRREYARTLLELGAGRQFWGVQLTFGECDAALRVRRAANWKKERLWEKPLALGLTVLLGLFLFTNPAAEEAHFVTYLHHSDTAPCIDTDLRERFGESCGVEDIWLTGGDRVLVETTDGRWVSGSMMLLEHTIPRMQFAQIDPDRAEALKRDAIDFPR